MADEDTKTDTTAAAADTGKSTNTSGPSSISKPKKEKDIYCCKGLILSQNEFLESLLDTIQILPTKATKSKSWLRNKKKIIDSEMESVSRTHKSIMTYGEATDSDVKAYFSGKIYNKIRNSYCDLSADIDDMLGAQVANDETLLEKKCGSEKADIKLPRLDLPKFSGKYEEWLPFHNLFKASVGNNKSLEPVQKLHFLMKSVSDDAYMIIKNLSLTAENYEKAMDLLDKQFNHTRKIAHTYMQKLIDGKPIVNENAKDIRNFISIVKDCMISLEDLKLPVKEWGYILLYVLQSKIPQATYTKWEEELGSSRDIPKLDDFLGFLEKRYRTLEMLEVPEKDNKKNNKVLHLKSSSNQKDSSKQTKPKPHSKKEYFKKSSNNIQCMLCTGEHLISRCKKFLNNTPVQRRNLAAQYKLCFNCLGCSHTIDVCYSMKTCIYCKQQHHSLLHLHDNDQNVSSAVYVTMAPERMNDSISTVSSSNDFYASPSNFSTKILGTAMVRLVNDSGFHTTARVLLDSGAEDNYITSSMVHSAGLKKYYAPSLITGLNDVTVGSVHYKVNLKIESLDGKFEYFTEASVVDAVTKQMPSRFVDPEYFGYLNNLKLADPNFNSPGQTNLLLGVSFVVKIRQAGLKKYKDLMAEHTLLGWVVMGETSKDVTKSSSSVFLTKRVTNNELSAQLQQFLEAEDFSVKIPEKPEDVLCERKFRDSIKRCKDGRLSVALPFREDNPVIGPSRAIALKRFLTLERKLEQNPLLKKKYHQIFQEYLENKYLIPINTTCNDGREFFLPHHAVVKQNDSSSEIKVRVVLDGSCKSADGSSLNDNLLTGPKLQTDIRDVFFLWRFFRIALTADITKMYMMFWVDERHHKYQKVLWRFNKNEDVKEYALTTITFGTSSAPYQAIRALKYIAEQEMDKFPVAAKTVSSEFYVDDFISGAHSVEEAIQKQTELREMLLSYGLTIKKWSSNNIESLVGIQESDKETLSELRFGEEEFRKTLGVYWAPKEDFFSFSADKFNLSEARLTKRNILSQIARLYDPLGWVGPCMLHAKLIMQRVWEQNLSWDEEVSGDIKHDFLKFLDDLSCLSNVKIPRWINITDDFSPIKLYGFSDASLKAYGAVIYLLNPNVTDKKRLILLSSKTKVKPLKHISLARLELCAAVILTDLIKWATTLLNPRPVKVFAFSDSKTVLSWLNSHPSRWKMYVASRTTKILETTKSDQWNYVNTKNNPADFTSRGLLPSDILSNSLWWDGPPLESLHNEDNKISDLTDEDNTSISIEEKVIIPAVFTTTSNENSLHKFIEKYSSHSKMCRIMSYLLKFIRNCILKVQRKRPEKQNDNLMILILCTRPEMVICRLVQAKYFASEMKSLENNQPLDRKSSLLSLNPFIDGFGVLRVGGRLDNSKFLSYDQKHPILLPTQHQVVKNLILMAHHATLHGTKAITESYLRHKYHIIRVGDRIKYYVQRCPTCIRYARHSHQQLMGSLPEDRVNPHRAFLNTGIDYAGPFTLKAYGVKNT